MSVLTWIIFCAESSWKPRKGLWMSGSPWVCSLRCMIKDPSSVILALVHIFSGMVWSTTRDINMDSTGTNSTTIANERNWLMLIKNYFCIGVPTTDPLLFTAKLVVYATEVHSYLSSFYQFLRSGTLSDLSSLQKGHDMTLNLPPFKIKNIKFRRLSADCLITR